MERLICAYDVPRSQAPLKLPEPWDAAASVSRLALHQKCQVALAAKAWIQALSNSPETRLGSLSGNGFC